MEKSPKKWSLGNILFRKSKKDIPQADFSSDDDDRKAGFGNDFIKKSPAKVKTNKQLVQGFDQQQYSVANPEFHYYKPAQPQQSYQPQQQQPQQQLQYQRTPQIYQNNFEYINNQINLDKNRTTLSPQYIYNTNNNYLQYQGSSQDEKSSYNSLSSPINKSGSETGSRTSLNKKTRSARNERYYQRIMRDEGRPQTVYGSVNSIENNPKYQSSLTNGNNRLSASLNSSSICSSDFQMPTQPPPMMMMTMNQSSSLPITRSVVFRGNSNNNKSVDADEDKDDYENIHEVDDSVPPPIPPRDPNRRFSINSSVSQNPYYFDQALQKYVIFNTNGKCFSDDKLWKHENERPTSARNSAAVTDNKHEMNIKQQHDILRPRSRKPLNLNTNLDNECVFSSEDVVDNPRQYPISQRSKSAIDFEKMMSLNDQQPIVRNKFAQRQRNLTSVEPIKYQQMQNSFASEELQALRKKYTSAEDINKNKVNMRSKLPTANTVNTPGTRKSLNEMDLKVKENIMNSNLDDAINELETMYKNLIKDENLMERAARRDLPTPTKFTQLMRKYEEYENEENHNDKEPDILLDDVFSRNLKHANQKIKLQEHQPPFGIPNHKLYPIPPKPSQDYLSVEPVQMRKTQPTITQNNPDVVADDLAVRNLRKDNPNYNRRRNMIEVENNHFMKRNHTLSSLSDHIYNGILKDSAKPSGGKLDDYLNFDLADTKPDKKDVKSTLYLVNKNPNEREDFEKSLNALVVESKAISQKLEKDLSKLKRESVTPKPTTAVQQQPQPKTLVTLLDFRKSIEREKEKKSTSCSPIKSLQSPAGNTATSNENKPQMTSTACSPIKDLQDVCPPKEEIIKSQAPKQQKTEKIGNLIKMFNTTTMSSPEPIKKQSAKILMEKPSRKLSDLSNMFEKAPEVDTKPPTQPSSLSSASSTTSSLSSMTPYVKKTTSSSSIDEKTIDQKTSIKLISPRIVSPTVMNPKVRSVISPKKINPAPAENSNTIKADVESNINNIKELIQQIKLTEFEKMNKRDAMKPDILKSTKSSDLPDYDNIKDDYEMTDGKLERISNKNKISNVVIATTESETKPTIITATLVIKPDFLPNEEPLIVTISKESSEIEYDENSPELKSITTTSSSLRETSVESSSKDSSSIENRSNNNISNNSNVNNDCADSAAIYKDAIEFLKENVDQKAVTAATNEDDHKSPIKSMRQNKEAVLNYIGKINENLEAVKSQKSEEIEAAQPKMSVKESVSKLEQKISLSRQNSETVSDANVSTTSEASQYNTPSKEPSTPITIKPVVLPKVGPSDTESLYNSSEELSMIFGHAEQQQQQNVQIHPGKIIEEDFEAEFEKIANDDEILDDKILDENFNITLIDINNNNEYAECFDNELSDITNESAMSTKSDVSASNFFRCDTEDDKKEANGSCFVSDANNNSLTNELSKLNAECFTNTLMNRKPNPSTSKSSNNSLKSSSSQKSKDNNSCTATSSQQQPLKTQCILLACLYCVMLYLQFIIFNFSKS